MKLFILDFSLFCKMYNVQTYKCIMYNVPCKMYQTYVKQSKSKEASGNVGKKLLR